MGWVLASEERGPELKDPRVDSRIRLGQLGVRDMLKSKLESVQTSPALGNADPEADLRGEIDARGVGRNVHVRMQESRAQGGEGLESRLNLEEVLSEKRERPCVGGTVLKDDEQGKYLEVESESAAEKAGPSRIGEDPTDMSSHGEELGVGHAVEQVEGSADAAYDTPLEVTLVEVWAGAIVSRRLDRARKYEGECEKGEEVHAQETFGVVSA